MAKGIRDHPFSGDKDHLFSKFGILFIEQNANRLRIGLDLMIGQKITLCPFFKWEMISSICMMAVNWKLFRSTKRAEKIVSKCIVVIRITDFLMIRLKNETV